jgi:hypothetical protein
MTTRMKWSVFPIALLTMGTFAMAQNQTPSTQGSSSSANSAGASANGARSGQLTAGEPIRPDSKETAIYGDTVPDGSAAGSNSMLIATMAVNRAIDDLTNAFANRDSGAIKQLWPSIPEKPFAALQKSFSYFSITSRNFRPENINVNGDTATVSGSYSGSFVSGEKTIPSSGRFSATLRRTGTRWFLATLVCN